MDLFDIKNLGVSPFLICPTAHIDKERTLIFGPNWMRDKQEKLSNDMLALANGHYCKIVALAIKQADRLIVSQVFSSNVADQRTNRKGLYAICGGVIKMRTFLTYRNVCQSLFEEFQTFINSHGGSNYHVTGIDCMVNLFQELRPHKELINKESLQSFIQEMESRFFVEERVEFIDFLRIRMRSLSIPREISRPCRIVEQAAEFWKQMDSDLSKVKNVVQVMSSK